MAEERQSAEAGPVEGRNSGEQRKKTGSKGSSGGNASKESKYELPGQRLDAPEEGNPERVFYESLLQQRPESAMVEVWLMERGLLGSYEKQHAAKERRQVRLKAQRDAKKEAAKEKVGAPASDDNDFKQVNKKQPTEKKGKKAAKPADDDDVDDDKPPSKRKSVNTKRNAGKENGDDHDKEVEPKERKRSRASVKKVKAEDHDKYGNDRDNAEQGGDANTGKPVPRRKKRKKPTSDEDE